MKMHNIEGIRIVLDTADNIPLYWPVDYNGDTGDQPLDPQVAHKLMREKIPFGVAVADPNDKHSHYESKTVQLHRI